VPEGYRAFLLLTVILSLTWRSQLGDSPWLWIDDSSHGQADARAVGGRVLRVDHSASSSRRLALGLPVRLNSASAAQLESVPGIGPRRAANIVENRRIMGCFSRLSELSRVSGIGPKTAAKIAPYLGLGTHKNRACVAPIRG